MIVVVKKLDAGTKKSGIAITETIEITIIVGITVIEATETRITATEVIVTEETAIRTTATETTEVGTITIETTEITDAAATSRYVKH